MNAFFYEFPQMFGHEAKKSQADRRKNDKLASVSFGSSISKWRVFTSKIERRPSSSIKLPGKRYHTGTIK
jgi:hypothetical protein